MLLNKDQAELVLSVMCRWPHGCIPFKLLLSKRGAAS